MKNKITKKDLLDLELNETLEYYDGKYDIIHRYTRIIGGFLYYFNSSSYEYKELRYYSIDEL